MYCIDPNCVGQIGNLDVRLSTGNYVIIPKQRIVFLKGLRKGLSWLVENSHHSTAMVRQIDRISLDFLEFQMGSFCCNEKGQLFIFLRSPAPDSFQSTIFEIAFTFISKNNDWFQKVIGDFRNTVPFSLSEHCFRKSCRIIDGVSNNFVSSFWNLSV